jgi:putative addiction module killer protein
MIELRKTAEFDKWFRKIRDDLTRARISSRILQLREGRTGDHKHVGEGVWELRLHFGPGYRLYYAQHGREWILLVAGGEKSSQEKDIRLAWKLARKAREGA